MCLVCVCSQRLKAAIHYGVGQISEEVGEEEGVSFQKHFVAALAEATFKYATTAASDLELFAKLVYRPYQAQIQCKHSQI